MVWPWLASSVLSITKIEIAQLRKSTSPVHKPLCISGDTCSCYSAQDPYTLLENSMVGRGQSSPLLEKADLSGSFLSLHLSPLNSSPPLPTHVCLFTGGRLYIPFTKDSQWITSVPRPWQEPDLDKTMPACPSVCIFQHNWILDSFCFFLI